MPEHTQQQRVLRLWRCHTTAWPRPHGHAHTHLHRAALHSVYKVEGQRLKKSNLVAADSVENVGVACKKKKNKKGR